MFVGKTYQNLLEKGFFVFYMKNCFSAVNCIKSFSREFPFGGITHFKLHLLTMQGKKYF